MVEFSTHGDMCTAVNIYVHTGIHEGQDNWLSCGGNVRVHAVSCELFYLVFVDIGEGVNHVPETTHIGVMCCAQVRSTNTSM